MRSLPRGDENLGGNLVAQILIACIVHYADNLHVGGRVGIGSDANVAPHRNRIAEITLHEAGIDHNNARRLAIVFGCEVSACE